MLQRKEVKKEESEEVKEGNSIKKEESTEMGVQIEDEVGDNSEPTRK